MAPVIGIGIGASHGDGNPRALTPTFNVAAGAYSVDQSVTISCATSGATIYYRTTDDTGLTSAWQAYASPVSMIYPGGTLEAYATKSGMSPSAVASAVYTFTMPAIVAAAIGVYDEPTGANVTLDGGTGILTWKNNSVAGSPLPDLTSRTGGAPYNAPTQNATGGRWGGASSDHTAASYQAYRTATTHALSQPRTQMIRGKRSAGAANLAFLDGSTATYDNTAVLYINSDTVGVYAGTYITSVGAAGSGANWCTYWGVFDDAGSGSRLGREDKTYGHAPAGATTGTAGTAASDGISAGSRGTSTTWPFDGSMDRVLVWNSNVAEADLAKANEYWDGNARRYIWVDGDSLTAGTGSTGGANGYPIQLQSLLTLRKHRVVDYGVVNQTLVDMEADFATQFVPLLVSRRHNVYVLWGGINDIFANADGPTVASRRYTLAEEAAAAGFTVIALTNTKCGTLTGAQETARTYANADLLANYAAHGITAVYDAASEANLQNPADGTYFYQTDGLQVHLVDAGYAIIAAGVQATLVALGIAA